MQFQGTGVPTFSPEVSDEPLVAGSRAVEVVYRPVVPVVQAPAYRSLAERGSGPRVRIRYPLYLSAEEMVAALATFSISSKDELNTPEMVREEIEFLVLVHGMDAVHAAVDGMDDWTGDRGWMTWCCEQVAALVAREGAHLCRGDGD
jgi:hypothetical protein